MKTLSLVLYITLFSAALAQPLPAQQAATATATQGSPAAAQPVSPESRKPGALEGRVVNAKTSEPVRRVNLTLRPFGGPQGFAGTARPPSAPYGTTTDGEGKFRIENVEPGVYRLMAERQGFVRQEYGARRLVMMGASITVAPGQELKDLNFKLTPQAVLIGRVLDEEGEPLARAQIQVLTRRFFQGKQQLVPAGGGQTIDTGEFRVADLPAGRYWVSALYRRSMFSGEMPARNPADRPEEEYVTTYYPNAIDQANASGIDLQSGQEMAGVEIRLQKARVYRIRGKVVDTAGQPVRNVRLMLMPRERNAGLAGFMGGGAQVREDGGFEVGGVQPGAYSLVVAPMGGPNTPGMVGRTPVDVGRTNVEGVVLVVGSGITLTGTIRIDGSKQELEQATGRKIAFESTRVQLMTVEGRMFSPSRTVTKADGSFVIENLGPDKYRIALFPMPEGTWLKSVRVGNHELLETGLDVTAEGAGPVEVILGVGTGQVDGVVQDAKQQPASGSMVTLLPDPFKENRNDLYRMTATDQNGRFSLTGIAPGEYKLFAWEEVDPGAYTDPEFLKPHDSKAQKISVKENSQQQMSVVQIPAEATTKQ